MIIPVMVSEHKSRTKVLKKHYEEYFKTLYLVCFGPFMAI